MPDIVNPRFRLPLSPSTLPGGSGPGELADLFRCSLRPRPVQYPSRHGNAGRDGSIGDKGSEEKYRRWRLRILHVSLDLRRTVSPLEVIHSSGSQDVVA
jgi:hypothetical protein